MINIKDNFWRYVLFISLSVMTAGGSMGIAYLINAVINSFLTGVGIKSTIYFYYFFALLVVFFVCRWTVSFNVIGLTQKLLSRTRMQILEMILKSSYHSLLKNKEKIYNAMTRDAANIVQASVSIVDIVTNGIIVLICFIYMGTLSWKLLLSLFGLLTFTVLVYLYGIRKQRNYFNKAMAHDDKFVKYLSEILEGFKEIVIDRRKGTGIKEKKIIKAVDASVGFNRKAFLSNLNNRVIGQVSFYIFIAVILLYLGQAFGLANKVLINFVFLVLYIYGPIETVIVLLPVLSQATASLNRLSFLKQDLETTSFEEVAAMEEGVTFEKLEIKDLYYEYKDDSNEEVSFCVGPVNFHISSGEVVFIFGGNGSGKTTLINLLIGLFASQKGEFFLNESKIEDTQSVSYKIMFAPVFNDFHLFDECYGIENINVEKVKEYLAVFELEGKVAFEEGKFTTINLSTGQRKRLALICAMLENKPILVLDEFAADQDPYFRKKFYSQILEMIRKEGFTVIAVTHDENYYDYCDSLYKMDSGRLHPVKRRQWVELG